MSNVMKRSIPSCAAIAAAPTKPPAGPDSTVRTASSDASSAEIEPPFDWNTRRPTPGRLACSDRMYPCIKGET